MDHPPSKKSLGILLSETEFQALFSAIITDVISGKREFSIHASTHALQIMTFAACTHFNLFILFLNNIVFPSDNMPSEKRLKQALKLATQLKTRYQKPIIGLYG
jgi:hypothetical protein